MVVSACQGPREEEQGQGVIEYTVLMGGVVTLALLVFSTYLFLARETGVLGLDSTIRNVSSIIEDRVASTIRSTTHV
jgi:hypothetical protein